MKSSRIRTRELTMTGSERMSLKAEALAALNSEASRDSEADLTSHSVMQIKFSESSLEEGIHSSRSSMKMKILCMRDSVISDSQR